MVADLPVGQNLQDHCSAFNSYELSPTIPNVILKTINPLNIAEYLANRTGKIVILFIIFITIVVVVVCVCV